jgi:hypothetical protein
MLGNCNHSRQTQHARLNLSSMFILIELGIPQNAPSPIYGDNMAAILMANNTRPTYRTRHLDIGMDPC